MRRPYEAWRRLWRWWTVPLAVLLAALVGLAVYQTRFSARNADLEERLAARRAELERRAEIRSGYEAFLQRSVEVDAATGSLYRDRFSTEEERFTAAVREVRSLARTAGLEPLAISYPEDLYEAHQLIGRSFDFSVEGTYEQLRRLINLIELSDHFLILREVSLAGSDSGTRLQISLAIGTVFSDPEAAALRTSASSQAAPRASAEPGAGEPDDTDGPASPERDASEPEVEP